MSVAELARRKASTSSARKPKQARVARPGEKCDPELASLIHVLAESPAAAAPVDKDEFLDWLNDPN